ncbi:MAG: ATP-binding cassette domain-containing protein [Candidatus Tectomicrobia bacterium]|uniref:ATP-binding cassette domain-containing protein n=1 Tax=Tectimicrobiota bacterium TaxID=2528274 RepID=A0A932FY70_UNCTE|nr:ATP-binding cassette domain-containing protein [Candidatus Tectomicrobia bacterium]
MRLSDWLRRDPAHRRRRPGKRKGKERFLDQTLHQIVFFTEETLFNERIPQRDGLLQRIDPRLKIAGLTGMVILLSFQRTLEGITLFLLAAFGMALASRVPPLFFLKRLLPAFAFTALVAMPAMLNLIVPGRPLLTLYAADQTYRLLGLIEVPTTLSLTREGAFSAWMLISRVTASVSLILLITLTTHPARLIQAIASFMPGALGAIASIGYRYIFFLVRTVEQFILGFQSRSFAPLQVSGKQQWVASRIGLLFSISLKLSRDLEKAMESRGYRLTTPGREPESSCPAEIPASERGPQSSSLLWGESWDEGDLQTAPDDSRPASPGGSHAMKVFELEEVSYRYKSGHQSIDRLSLSISEQESLTLIGANGSGKSTLLFLLDGLVPPESGMFRVFGHRITQGFPPELRQRIAFLFQNPQVQLFSLTVLEELSLGPAQLGLPPQEIERRVQEILKFLKIEHLIDKCPWNLSEGEMKKVALGTCLSINPDVLLLDEPTNGLDPRSQADFIELIQRLRRSGKTILTVTHDLSIIEDLSDRTIVLGEDHRILKEGKPYEILQDRETLLAANLIHKHLHRHSWYVHEHSHYGEHEHTPEM